MKTLKDPSVLQAEVEALKGQEVHVLSRSRRAKLKSELNVDKAPECYQIEDLPVSRLIDDKANSADDSFPDIAGMIDGRDE